MLEIKSYGKKTEGKFGGLKKFLMGPKVLQESIITIQL